MKPTCQTNSTHNVIYSATGYYCSVCKHRATGDPKYASRNYNINRPIDTDTVKFESELNALLERYRGTNIETESFDENDNCE